LTRKGIKSKEGYTLLLKKVVTKKVNYKAKLTHLGMEKYLILRKKGKSSSSIIGKGNSLDPFLQG